MAAMLSSLSFLLTLNVFLMSFFSTILYIVLLISINLLFKKKLKKMMVWKFNSEGFDKICKSWNIAIRTLVRLPFNTHTHTHDICDR